MASISKPIGVARAAIAIGDFQRRNGLTAQAVHSTVQEKAERLGSFRFFRECPEDFFLALAMITDVRAYPSGALIIEEQKPNDSLYFLLSGSVEVMVQGERVAVLDQPGDLLGEMSVITSRPTSATIVALEPTSVYVIGADRLEDLIETSRRDFGYRLYRTYALILSEKMVATNEKARRFEIANRALQSANQALEDANRTLDQKVRERTEDLERSRAKLEAQNTELFASHRKLEELYTSKDLTFQTLTELSRDHLAPLEIRLREMESNAAEESRPQIHRALAEVENSQAMLRPLTTLYSTEQAMRSRRVLLVESDRKSQSIAKLALGGTGVRLDIVGTAEELQAFLDSGESIDIVFVSPGLAAPAATICQRHPEAKLVLMASTDIPGFLPILRAHPIYTNIVSRDAEDRTFTVKNIVTTATKLLSHDLFGLEKYLMWGVDVHERHVTSSTDRAPLIAEMQDRFAALGVRSRISDRAALVAEELLMNAIYDAPCSPTGEPLYNHLPRTQVVNLAERERAEFRFACDGMLAAISVGDPFGGFQTKILLDYLERNYTGAEQTQVAGKAGAGRGLHQIIENSDLVVINVRPKVRTEMIALFNLDAQADGHEGRTSFHFFLD
ncbi:MAG: cyclic nucleotide-binding domain-containing protein [Bdellovibrionaceae bacterium]|nr:cyclic nucleotide-binding domain-containing protein [Pseudobdellovibrionaceae bacterium]